LINAEFWRGRRVLITGHTGFKGGWLASWLIESGAQVTGFALPPSTMPSYFELCQLGRRMKSIVGDVRDYSSVESAIREAKPEIVFHLAAQSLVLRSYAEPVATFAANVMGTAHVLEAIRGIDSVRAVVIVTSDKCYENDGSVSRPYREDDPMGGRDPYSASKGCAELVTAAYRRAFFATTGVAVASVRAGNVIGGGDWADDRIVPDTVRAFTRGEELLVRNPGSIRPWQHVLDPLCGYLTLAQRLYLEGQRWAEGWNFGPPAEQPVTVAALADALARGFGRGVWRAAGGRRELHEAPALRLDSSKAQRLLGWRSRLNTAAAIQLTVEWYQACLSQTDCYGFSAGQIRYYDDLESPDAATRSA
jgi:CDP-glucose 4,6-dehydratase